MRQIATFLLFGVALTAGAAEIWRWKDANGVVHYSDQPRPGAEQVQVSVQPPSGDAPTARNEAAQSPNADGAPDPRQRPFAYTSCTVTSPAHDETFQGVQAIRVDLAVEPGLQPGHRVQVFHNAALRPDWPAESTSFTFSEVFRGSHTLSVRILDANGRVVCTGPSITFHLQQAGLLSPGRQTQ
jgi:hypothetical protein